MGKPAWLQGLMEETFFGNCGAHQNTKKKEKNIFCLQCCLSFCPHCLPSHLSHPILQVRRYVYHDVVRQADLEKLIDCTYIQPYTINSAKVIFLNDRPQARPCKVATNICFTCDRILQDPFNFCSLSCKVNHYEGQGINLSNILFGFNESEFTFSQFRGLSMDGSVVAEDDGLILEDRMLHGSSCSMGQATDQPFKKKKKKEKRNEQSQGNRRKGAPHRSPLA